MSVYDKELIINGEAVRSPEQQVYKNMKDIKALQEIIKKMYKTSETLTDASVSVAIADTNAPEGTTEGWLITEDGLLFSITGGDDTNLLLAFYSDLKGPQGEQGPSANSDKGFYITSTAPTEDDGVYTISSGSLNNVGTGIDIKVNDIIVYIDSNDEPTSMWQITAISGTTLTVQSVGTYAKGKQLYQHNAIVTYTFNGTTRMKLYPVINDSNVAFTQATFSKYLYDNNFKTKDNCWGLNGYHNLSGDVYFDGAFSIDGSSLKIYSSKLDMNYNINSFTDNVIEI